MQKLLSYLRLAFMASCLCSAGLAMAGVTLTAKENSLGETFCLPHVGFRLTQLP